MWVYKATTFWLVSGVTDVGGWLGSSRLKKLALPCDYSKPRLNTLGTTLWKLSKCAPIKTVDAHTSFSLPNLCAPPSMSRRQSEVWTLGPFWTDSMMGSCRVSHNSSRRFFNPPETASIIYNSTMFLHLLTRLFLLRTNAQFDWTNSFNVQSPNMHSALIASFILSIRLSYAWTTSVSFQVYLEFLESNPIGLSGTALMQYFRPNTIRALTLEINHHVTHYNWQIYPSPNIAPNNRPRRPPSASQIGPLARQDWNRFDLAVGHCTDIPPGICCRAIVPHVTSGQFSHLPPGTISAFWGNTVTDSAMEGCNGQILDSHYGSPQWEWQDPTFPPRILGASYISCPSSNIERGWGSVLAGFCARMKRGTDSKAESVPPSQVGWVWPDMITIDGVNYTDDRKGDLLYHDSENRLVNLTGLIQRRP